MRSARSLRDLPRGLTWRFSRFGRGRPSDDLMRLWSGESRNMAGILCVGVATLDIVNRVAEYPGEDSEVRASAQTRRVGGNAANTAIMLSSLGECVAWLGNLGDGPEAGFIRGCFDYHGVDHHLAPQVAGGRVPTSCVTLSEASGSRTIVHFRDLPEYPASHFLALDLSPFRWVHFEGRAIAELKAMLAHVRARYRLSVSLEVEKPREGIEALFGEVDLLLFSRDYLAARAVQEPAGFLQRLPPGIQATCTWGVRGAWGRDEAGVVIHQPAWKPPQVVDTLGAGDVFNAGMIHAASRGWPMQRALAFASRLAGEKCGREGVALG